MKIIKPPSDNTMYAVRYAHPNCAFGTTSHTPRTLAAVH